MILVGAKVFAVAVVAFEALYLAYGDPVDLRLYRGVHMLQMVGLIAVMATSMEVDFRGVLMLAVLVTAFAGNVVTSGLFDETSFSAEGFSIDEGGGATVMLIAMPLLACSYLLLTILFKSYTKQSRRWGMLACLSIGACVSMYLWSSESHLISISVGIYAAVSLYMAWNALPLLGLSRKLIWVVVGSWLLLVSDGYIATTLFLGVERTLSVNAIIWATYMLGQVGVALVVFSGLENHPLVRKDRQLAQ